MGTQFNGCEPTRVQWDSHFVLAYRCCGVSGEHSFEGGNYNTAIL
jgi:hypothetical protein